MTLKDDDPFVNHQALYEKIYQQYHSYKIVDKDTFSIASIQRTGSKTNSYLPKNSNKKEKLFWKTEAFLYEVVNRKKKMDGLAQNRYGLFEVPSPGEI